MMNPFTGSRQDIGSMNGGGDSRMQNYLNSSFGGYPYNGGGNPGQSPLKGIGAKSSAPAAPAAPPVNTGGPSASGPMPYQFANIAQNNLATSYGTSGLGMMHKASMVPAGGGANLNFLNSTMARTAQPTSAPFLPSALSASVAPGATPPGQSKTPVLSGGGVERSISPLARIGVPITQSLM